MGCNTITINSEKWLFWQFPQLPLCASALESVQRSVGDSIFLLFAEGWGFDRFLVSSTYARLGQYLELVCCAVNYDSLTWTFNNQPYPWFSEVNSLG